MITESKIPLIKPNLLMPTSRSEAVEKARRVSHRTIAGVGEDLDSFHFNKAIARIRELTNLLDELIADDDGAKWVYRNGMEIVTRLIAPMTPHLAEEMWYELGHKNLVVETPWPDFDPTLLEENTVTIAVQINGKLRGTIDVPRNATQHEVEPFALGLAPVEKLLGDRKPHKVIFVPNKIVNIVV